MGAIFVCTHCAGLKDLAFSPTKPVLMHLRNHIGYVVLAQLLLLPSLMAQNVAITTHHYDNYRTGWNNHESVLTPANVGSESFGIVYSVPLDAQVDAQPLIVPHETITAGNDPGVHDVVYVASEGNTIYAIDANTGEVLLNPNFGPPVIITLPVCGVGPTVGIKSTPVIDLASKTMYVVVYTVKSGRASYGVHALDLGNLTDKVPPVVIKASHTLNNGSNITFDAGYQLQRPALLLANGNVYAAFGSFCDQRFNRSRGWLLGWQASSLTPLASNQLFDSQATSPNDYFLASVWMSGWGIAADTAGDLYLVTANSDPGGSSYDGVTDLQESVLKISPDLSQVVDLFTPFDWADLDEDDHDFGSGGVTLLPRKPTALPQDGPELAVAAGKEGTMFLMDQHDLGGYDPLANHVLGEYSIGRCLCGSSSFVDPVDKIPRVVSSGGATIGLWKVQYNPTLGLVNVANSGTLFHRSVGFFTVVSSNGLANPIIWALGRNNYNDDDLNFYAFDPEAGGGTLQQIFFSSEAGEWPYYDVNPNLIPVVANGKVFIASGQVLTVFGLDDRLNRQKGRPTPGWNAPLN